MNNPGTNPPWASVLFPSKMTDIPWGYKRDTILEDTKNELKYKEDDTINKTSGPNWSRTTGSLLRKLLEKIKIE